MLFTPPLGPVRHVISVTVEDKTSQGSPFQQNQTKQKLQQTKNLSNLTNYAYWLHAHNTEIYI